LSATSSFVSLGLLPRRFVSCGLLALLLEEGGSICVLLGLVKSLSRRVSRCLLG
jgi:hypothetical protein